MKLSIIASQSEGPHLDQLLAAAKKYGFDVELRDLTLADLNSKLPTRLGDAIIWRSSALKIRSERPALLGYLRNKIMISYGVFQHPLSYQKYFQQQYLQSHHSTAKWSIPTFRFHNRVRLIKAIQEGTLQLPVIAKPNAGSQGKGIVLLRTERDCQAIKGIPKYVFQSFIPNYGDWRVIVVGGTPLGAMRRLAAAGSYLNNISQGATAVRETDPKISQELYKIATKVASIFELAFCGVDIIRNQETGDFLALEVNTAPQWNDDNGFQSIVGVNISDKLMEWIKAREALAHTSTPEVIEAYYKDRISIFPNESFHFASRLWLWTGDTWARQVLDQKKDWYIGQTEKSIQRTITRALQGETRSYLDTNTKKSYRRIAFERYPDLDCFNRILFKVMFCDTLYGQDIRPQVRQHIDDARFLALFRDLINDQDAVRLLSTHAVNYFYLLKNYFKDRLSLTTAVLVDPYELLALLPGYKELESKKIIDEKTSIKLQIYLLTHAIIGQSRFYAATVKGQAWKQLCRELEQMIEAHYYDVSLDNKLEFLVCATICQYQTDLRGQIEREAQKSVSWAGNFLVDSLSGATTESARHCLRVSEHRNVLYLMSQKSFRVKRQTGAKAFVIKKRLIGRLARVKIPDYGLPRLVARVDSGATRSSIAASNVREEADGLHFHLMHPSHHLYTGQEFTAKDYKVIDIKTTSNKNNRRYAVVLPVTIDDRQEMVTCTLADREHMLYPMLLGRNFLTGRYRVDTDKQFVRTVKIPRKRATLGTKSSDKHKKHV